MDSSRAGVFLARLGSEQAEAAWAQFVDECWPLLLKIVRQVERDDDDASDCFLYVCEQLRRNRFARLRRFDPAGPASFPTWLGLVVTRLCVDWHRRRSGRLRIVKAIARLPMLERAVFQAVHEGGSDLEAAWTTLRMRFPNLTIEEVGRADSVVRGSLRDRDQRVLAKRVSRRDLLRATSLDDDAGPEVSVLDASADPEARASTRERSLHLGEAVRRLSPADRLLLKLRFTDELTLSEVARITGLKNPQAVDRRLGEILGVLRSSL